MRGIVVAGVLLWCGAALAQPMHSLAPAFVPMSPAIEADRDAIQKMTTQMDVPYSGDADRDFVQRMIGHHQGAIDLARIELKYGRDSRIRQAASDIIAAEQRDMTMMQAWLAGHPARTPHPANPHIQWK